MSRRLDGGRLEVDAMVLFLGPEPWRVIGRVPGSQPTDVQCDSPSSGTRATLVLAGTSEETGGDRLPGLIRECHRELPPGGRVALLSENPAFRRLAALKWLVTGRGRRNDGKQPGVGLSLRTLLRGVRDAGFRRVTAYAGLPSPHGLKEVRPLSRLDRWMAPAFLVIAEKEGNGCEFLLDQVMTSLHRQFGLGEGCPPWGVRRVLNSFREKSVVLLDSGEERAVVRIPRSELMREDEARSHQVLQRLQSNSAISRRVPRPLVTDEIGGVWFFVQTHLEGVPLSTLISNRNRPAYLREADDFLRALNPQLPGSPVRPIHDTPGATMAEPIREFVLRQIPDVGLQADSRALIDESLRGAQSRLGVVHGDFGAANILVTGSRISGVIDWEASREGAPPVLDAFNYLDSTHRACSSGQPSVDAVPLLAEGDWPITGEMDFLRDFFTYCGVDFRFRRGFALLYLLSHIGLQLRFPNRSEGPIVRLENVLQQLLR